MRATVSDGKITDRPLNVKGMMKTGNNKAKRSLALLIPLLKKIKSGSK